MRLILAPLSFLLIPSLALAGHYGHYASGCSGRGSGLGLLAMALVAVLGWWVLRTSDRDKDKGATRKAGLIVGWTFVVVGLLGFLCAACHKVSKGVRHGKSCPLAGKAKKSCGHHGRNPWPYEPADALPEEDGP